MNSPSCLLTVLLYTCFFPSNGSGQDLFLKYYTLHEGFPHPQVWHVAQDRSGCLWFATGGGLVRYNGIRFTTYTKDDGLLSNIIRHVFQDDDGKLWVTSDDGVTVFDGRTFENYTEKDGLGAGFVWKTVKDRSGRYWFPTSSGGLSCFDGRAFRTYTTNDGLPTGEFRDGFMDRDGNLWFGTIDGCVVLAFQGERYDTSFVYFQKRGTQRFGGISSLSQDREGRILIASQAGLIAFDYAAYAAGSGAPEPHMESLSLGTWGTRRRIESVFAASDSSLWIATENGFGQLKKRRLQTYDVDRDYSSNSMHTILEDREGTVWFGTDGGGCFSIPYQNLRNFTTRNGLLSRVVNAVERDESGNIYIGTDDGLNILTVSGMRSLSPDVLRTGDPVWSLKVDRSGTLWIGTRNHLFEYVGGRVRERPDLYGRLNSPVLDIEEDREGRLWLATLDGMVVAGRGGTRVLDEKAGLPGTQIWCVYRDRQGTMWAGINGGLVRFDSLSPSGLRMKIYTTADGLPDNTVNVVRQDADGVYWIGTDLGFSRFDGTRFTNFKPRELGLFDNVVAVIEYDPFVSALWIGSRGFALYDHRAPVPRLIRKLDKGRGMVGEECTTNNSMLLDGKGNAWIGTFSGLTHYAHDRESKRSDIAPPVVVEAVHLVDSVIHVNHLTAATGEARRIKGNTLSFEFAVLSYRDERENMCQYRLDGFDEGWSEFVRKNEVRYTNLGPGEYTFHVRTRGSGMGDSASEAVWSFIVPWPWWLHPLFLFFVAAGSGGGIYGLHRLRVNRKMASMRRRNRELEEKVRERTSELMRQRDALEDLLTRLQRTQAQLVQSEKMAALGQLVAGVAHEINNPTSILAGNVNYIEEYLRILRKLIGKYETYPISDAAFQQEVHDLKRATDWEFVQADMDTLIASVKNAAERIRHIVLDLRNFSRLDEAEISEVDIHDCIDTTVKLFMNQYRHVLQIERQFRATNRVFCFVNQINQVLLNLLINSAQAIEQKRNSIPEGGQAGVIAIATDNDESQGLIVRIRDDGVGIPRDLQSRVFDPFFTTKPIGQGTGLGLSISYAIIVEKHRGSISCESEPGSWTEFTIRLPQKPSEIPS